MHSKQILNNFVVFESFPLTVFSHVITVYTIKIPTFLGVKLVTILVNSKDGSPKTKYFGRNDNIS